MEVWTPRDDEIAMLWAALILLRETNPASPPTLPAEASMLYSGQLNAQLDHIEADPFDGQASRATMFKRRLPLFGRPSRPQETRLTNNGYS